MNSINEDNSPNLSDTDDWTLLSPPHSESSTSSSPDQEIILSRTNSSTSSSLEHINNDGEDTIQQPRIIEEDDGLTEIDLSDSNYVRSKINSNQLAIIENDVNQADNESSQTRTSSSEPSISGFQAVETTSDDESVGSESSYNAHINVNNRRSSLTESESAEYVDLGKQRNELLLEGAIENYNVMSDQKNTIVEEAMVDCNLQTQPSPINRVKLIKTRLDELSEAISNQRTNSNNRSLSQLSKVTRRNYFLLFMIISQILLLLPTFMYLIMNQHPEREFDYSDVLDIKSIPTSLQYVELKLLYNELSQCVKRQSPASFKYYISEERSSSMWSQVPQASSFENDINNKYNARGLVCYGQENRWRKRFEQLKNEFQLDLPNMVNEAKTHITNEILKRHHPAFQFKLILNQIEYLEFLSKKREKKQAEETIKYLRAENLKLLRLANQPNETGYQKLFAELQMKNSQLIRENKALKASLTQKAGTTYIQQSHKLNELERETMLLKEFHNHVAKDLSKSLKQFGLHTVGITTNLDDLKSLNSQLTLTKNHLIRLTDGVSKVLLENESLKEELKEYHLLTTSIINRGSTDNADDQLLHNYSDHDNSNALIVNSCIRNLANLKEKFSSLEEEVDHLRKNCNKLSCNGDLERSFGHHLNKSDKSEYERTSTTWERLGLTQRQQTAIDKHNKNAFSLKDDIVDDLMVFLTKFNNQVESSGLAVINHLDLGKDVVNPIKLGSLGERTSEIVVLPNYLREIDVQQKKKNSLDDNKYYFAKSISDREEVVETLKLPPINEFSFPRSRTNFSETIIRKPTHDNKKLVSKEAIKSQKYTKEYSHSNATIQNESNSLNMTMQTLRDSWFFKRAKQRKQLRQNKEDFHTVWSYKRAKLREKLRKASSYIDDNYVNHCMYRESDKLPRPTLLNSNSKRHYQSSNSKQQQQNKNKHKQERFHNQRHNNHNYRHKNYHNNHYNSNRLYVYNHEEL